MTRRLFNLSAYVLMALCMAIVVLWVRSYHHYDEAYIGWPTLFTTKASSTFLTVKSYKGAFRLMWSTDFDDHPMNQFDAGWETHAIVKTFPIYHPRPQLLGFGAFAYGLAYGPFGENWHATIWELAIPHWAVALALIVLAYYRMRRPKRGMHSCPTCSYNLTANTSGVCPECGTAVPKNPLNNPG